MTAFDVLVVGIAEEEEEQRERETEIAAIKRPRHRRVEQRSPCLSTAIQTALHFSPRTASEFECLSAKARNSIAACETGMNFFSGTLLHHRFTKWAKMRRNPKTWR